MIDDLVLSMIEEKRREILRIEEEMRIREVCFNGLVPYSVNNVTVNTLFPDFEIGPNIVGGYNKCQ